jgi:hypothetical protein
MKIYNLKVIVGPHANITEQVTADKFVKSDGVFYFYLDDELISVYPVDRTIISSIVKK